VRRPSGRPAGDAARACLGPFQVDLKDCPHGRIGANTMGPHIDADRIMFQRN
jgi:hypothetical protein